MHFNNERNENSSINCYMAVISKSMLCHMTSVLLQQMNAVLSNTFDHFNITEPTLFIKKNMLNTNVLKRWFGVCTPASMVLSIDECKTACSISIANAMEILQSCTKSSIYSQLHSLKNETVGNFGFKRWCFLPLKVSSDTRGHVCPGHHFTKGVRAHNWNLAKIFFVAIIILMIRPQICSVVVTNRDPIRSQVFTQVLHVFLQYLDYYL